MNSETKQCQNCKQNFIIEPSDFEFYEKIQVPAPTWCPECRMIRKMVWRNERSLYKRNCDLCGKSIISIYPQSVSYKVYCQQCWWSDKWEWMEYEKEYNFSKPFFVQFKNLLNEVPRWNLVITNSQNSKYSNFIVDSKNCYLANSTIYSEDIINSNEVDKSRDCLECSNIQEGEISYNCINCRKIYRSKFLFNCRECIDSVFLFDCVNCQNCFMSSNLRNKKYVFRNKQYTKEEYFELLNEKFNQGSNQFLSSLIEEFKRIRIKSIHKYANITKCINSTGDYLTNNKNTINCFYGYDSENFKYGYRFLQVKDSMDCIFKKGEMVYESASGSLNSSRQKFCQEAFNSYDVEYCNLLNSSSNLFGCVGLRNKQYCILNKQYTKEEYEKLVPKIIEHMNKMFYIDKKGRIYRYGEFFPPELSPFCYNETIAQEYFPLTKEQALEQGYLWKEPTERNLRPTTYNQQLPDHIKDVPDSIINEIIQCQHAKIREDGTLEADCNEQCTTAFKIIFQELAFYRKMNLPLPRLCPNCRHYQRIKQRNPLKLWHRKCMCAGVHASHAQNNAEQTQNNAEIQRNSASSPRESALLYKNTAKHFHGNEPCPNEFETTYAPDRPEIVYCEKCYLAEVV